MLRGNFLILIACRVKNMPTISSELLPLHVHADGRVSWSPTMTMTVDCHTDVTYFPFDSQNCSLKVIYTQT